MLSPLIFAAFVVFPQDPPPTASGLISKMLLRYSYAKSLTGTVRTTQTAGSANVITETALSYERPSKIRLDQRQKLSDSVRTKLLVSDGTTFAYSSPDHVLGATPYLIEKVQQEGHDAQNVGDLYTIIASELPDRSPVLDLLIGRLDDLKYFKNQLAQFSLNGKETVNGKTGNLIEGAWRESEQVNVSGRFKMVISDGGELLRYVLTQTFASPGKDSQNGHPTVGDEQIIVTTTWDADIQVDAPIKPATFALKTG